MGERTPQAEITRHGRVVIVGQGYVGLPLAMRAVSAGYDVIGFDVSEQRIKRLEVGESFVEDVTDEELTAALATGRYKPSTCPRDCAGFDIAVVTVPTPLREGIPDLSFIDEAARVLARYLRPGATVVLESTTYPGTTEEMFGPALEEGSGLVVGSDFNLGYSPERVDPGNPVWHVGNTPKVVSGVGAGSLAAVKAFYDSITERTVPVSSPAEAELAKLLENTFRHVNIALVNELAMFANQLGINIWESIDAASTKPFGFMRFTPGPGVGGHCLPIDPSYLSWRVKRSLGHNFRFVELANDINEHMPEYVVQRLMRGLNQRRRALNGARVLLLGLTYKKNTSDARESPAIRVAELLRQMGATVTATDDHLTEDHVPAGVSLVDLNAAEVANADAVVILTDHDAFDYCLLDSHASYVLDCRRRLHPGKAERL